MSRSKLPGALCAAVAIMLIGTGRAGADDVDQGELRGAIRAAGHACAHVTSVEAHGPSAWTVTCNSGAFSVERKGGGAYAVSPKS